MGPPPRNKPQLTKAILDMKFMKKTKDRIEKELANTKGHKDLYANSITEEMRCATGNFVSEQSYLACVDLIEGRMSFGGMNPEIERLMELERLSKQPPGDMKKDISDEEMEKQFRKFKRNRNQDIVEAPPIKKTKRK